MPIDNARDDAAIVELRWWLTVNFGRSTKHMLAKSYGLSVVCVHSLIEEERHRRYLIEHPTTPTLVAPEPDPLTVGEDALLAYIKAGLVDPETDTVRSLAHRFRLSEVYIKERLHEYDVKLKPRPRKRAA